jgi:hypothetical protein
MVARPSLTPAAACALGALAACAHGFRITGQGVDDPTWSRGQSETSVAAGYGPYAGHIVVAYNDETGTEQTILFPPGSRKVLLGASLMGWSYSTDGGQARKAPRPNSPLFLRPRDAASYTASSTKTPVVLPWISASQRPSCYGTAKTFERRS